MRAMGLQGAVRGKPVRTTISDKAAPCPLDRVNRQFQAPRPNVLWVSDFTYVATWSGFVYVAFVIDAYARRIVGWRVSRTAHAGFVLDALEQALHERRPVQGGGLVHHSDRGVQPGFKWSSQHLERGGCDGLFGSGVRIGPGEARCPRLVGPLLRGVRITVSSGLPLRRDARVRTPRLGPGYRKPWGHANRYRLGRRSLECSRSRPCTAHPTSPSAKRRPATNSAAPSSDRKAAPNASTISSMAKAPI